MVVADANQVPAGPGHISSMAQMPFGLAYSRHFFFN
jgi:hypothetical protein